MIKEKIIEEIKLKDVINGTYETFNGVINVNGDVDISYQRLTKIPWQFGRVSGNFNCDGNYLKSLDNSPVCVGGSFSCANNKLIFLKNGPIAVKNSFDCSNNELVSLEFAPDIIWGHFDCSNNKIASLEFAPKIVLGVFDCGYNKIESSRNIIMYVGCGFESEHNLKPLKYNARSWERLKYFDCLKK